MYYSGTFSTVSVMTLLSWRSSAGEAKEWNTSSDIFNKSLSFFCNNRSHRSFIHLLIHTTRIHYNSWYYSSSWTTFVHHELLSFIYPLIQPAWIPSVYYSPSRTQSGLELPWQVPTIEAPGLKCKSISKPNLRWNKLGHPRISRSNTLLCCINIGQLGTVSGSLHKHKLLQSIMIKKNLTSNCGLMIAVIFTAANFVGLSQLWEAREREEQRALACITSILMCQLTVWLRLVLGLGLKLSITVLVRVGFKRAVNIDTT